MPGFQCGYCDQRFVRRDHLDRHEMSHTKEKPFQCRLCLRKFGRRDVLIRHNAQVHLYHSDSSRDSSRKSPAETATVMSADTSSRGDSTHKTYSLLNHSNNWKLPPSSTDFVSKSIFHGASFHTYRGPFLPDLSSLSPTTSAPHMDMAPIHQRFLAKPKANLSVSRLPAPSRSQSLPTSDILDLVDVDSLLKGYRQGFYVYLPFIHFPTFIANLKSSRPSLPSSPLSFNRPCTCDGEYPLSQPVPRCLLLSMLAIGAVMDSNAALSQKLYEETRTSIQEVLRRLRTTRTSQIPLYLLQTMLHFVAFGMCSGDEQIEHVSVGHINSLVRMADQYKADTSESPYQFHQESAIPEAHEMDAWIRDEERKRSLFSLMCFVSMNHTFLNGLPDIDISSANLRLPCDESLWEAETPEVWRARFVALPKKRLPTFRGEMAKLFAQNHELYSTSRSGSSGVNGTDIPSSDGPSQITEFGCLILVAALNQQVWKTCDAGSIDLHVPNLDSKAAMTRASYISASRRWQKIWISFSLDDASDFQYRRLMGCIPLMDHINLLLEIDIYITKEALQERKYESLGAQFVQTATEFQETLAAHDATRNNSLSTTDLDILQNAARYAVNALDLTFKLSPWWNLDASTIDVPPCAAMVVFHCVHIFCSWLLAVYNSDWELSGSDRSQERRDLTQRFCGIIASQEGRMPVMNWSRMFDNDPDSVMLAMEILKCFAKIYERKVTWGALTHLAKGFNMRALALQRQSGAPGTSSRAYQRM
ncbi:hypothetical protein IQ07DRAFT_352119 [Pyrenochaeta sp. DS3sAY3a]|nr:hypothetical protein IQ07DRAFT_352119 [Pyrenochaeta sp. DS3sAY3a]